MHISIIVNLCSFSSFLLYKKAGDSYLTQLAQYFGMVLVGALIPLLKKNKTAYNKIAQQEDEIRMNDMV